MAHALGDFLRLIISKELRSSRGRTSIAFLASSLHLCPMTMNNGSKLWSSADARLKQWKSSRRVGLH